MSLSFKATNNEVEYEAMLTGLCLALALGAKWVRINSDSQLVVRPVRGEYEAKDEQMKWYHALIVREKSWFKHFVMQQVS